MPYQYFTSSSQRFDSKSEQRLRKPIRFDSILSPRILIANVRYDSRAVRRFNETNRWHSQNHPALFVIQGLYHHRGVKRVSESARFSAINFSTIYQYLYRYEFRRLGRVTIHSFFDCIDDWDSPRCSGWSWLHDALMSQRENSVIRFDSQGENYETAISWLIDQCRYERHQLPIS